MCPLRFILVFFSALLAGYLAWRTVRSSPETELGLEDSDRGNVPFKAKDKRELDFGRMIGDGFWGFVDMASGRYLWRNLREMRKDEKMKNS